MKYKQNIYLSSEKVVKYYLHTKTPESCKYLIKYNRYFSTSTLTDKYSLEKRIYHEHSTCTLYYYTNMG